MEAIDDAKCVIVLWSQASVTSEWVKNEAAEGRDRHVLVPVLIDDVKIPFEFRRIQAARLVNWDGLISDPEFDLLVKSISRIIGPKIESVSIGSQSKPSDTSVHAPSIAVAPVKETIGPPIAEPSGVVGLTPHAERASSEAGSGAGDLPRQFPPSPAERMGLKFWHLLLVLIALVMILT